MKKIVILTIAVALWVSFSVPAFALLRRDFTAIEGPVESKSDAQKQIIVRNNSTGTQETFVGDERQISSVREGDTVLILHQIDNNAIGTIVVTAPRP